MPAQRRESHALVAVALAVVVGGVAATPAQAGRPKPTLKPFGTAQVRSVDGAAELTLQIGSRKIRAHLIDLDAPGPGECGARQATAALRGLVRRRSARFAYNLIRYDRHPGFVKYGGRYEVVLRYGARSERDLAADMLSAEWGRHGSALGLDRSLDITGADLDDTYGYNAPGFGEVGDAPRPARGLWVICGGRAHLPAGQAAPASSPATWSVSPDGITMSVGPITLAAGRPQTIGELAQLTPIEITATYPTCTAYLPALQLQAVGSKTADTCRATTVDTIRSWGPGGMMTTLGPKLGDPASALTGAFPAAAPVNDRGAEKGEPGFWALGGGLAGSWRTFAQVSSQTGRVTRFGATTAELRDYSGRSDVFGYGF